MFGLSRSSQVCVSLAYLAHHNPPPVEGSPLAHGRGLDGLFEDSITNGCTRVSPAPLYAGIHSGQVDICTCRDKKGGIQMLESEREAILREQTASKVFAPAFTRNFAG